LRTGRCFEEQDAKRDFCEWASPSKQDERYVATLLTMDRAW
jgi:hypothetical protein